MGATIAAVVVGLVLASGGPKKVVVPEGWYQIEEGYGEADDSEVALEVVEEAQATEPPAPQPPPQRPQAAQPPALPQPQPQQPDPSQPPPEAGSVDDEIRLFRQPDCELVRGRYLMRLLELHGVNTFALDPRKLAAWTYARPPAQALPYAFNGTLGDPAMAPLYGEPPIPPGPLSYDLELQGLAKDLLTCQNAPK